ncbi:hypothetical protein EDD85DRAFT_827650 [Armillaria nabsnona]|nr:hypothetical protein EDD85DRAFT_827650 [Armillaria nabsnona]
MSILLLRWKILLCSLLPLSVSILLSFSTRDAVFSLDSNFLRLCSRQAVLPPSCSVSFFISLSAFLSR